MPQFDISWFPSQIFWLVVTFAIFYFVLSNFVLPQLGAAIEGRASKIEGDLARALRSGGGEALAIALQAGGTSLLQAGLAKARAGLTSLAEIERVLGPPR